jgi:hypothetical protein
MVSPTANSFSTPLAEMTRLRQAATGTAIGAALLLFFGFVHLARPTGTDLFSHAWLAVYYALRIGGVASAAMAVWLWTGHRPALIVDAVVAVLLGAIFVLSGLAMLFDGGDVIQSAIITICGGTFVSSGFRNGRDYMQMIACGPGPASAARLKWIRDNSGGECARLSEPQAQARGPVSPHVHSVRPVAGGPGPDQAACPVRDRIAESVTDPAQDSPSTTDATAEPPPEGFLAAFARKKPPL